MNVEPSAAGLASGTTGFLQLTFGAAAAQLVGMVLTTNTVSDGYRGWISRTVGLSLRPDRSSIRTIPTTRDLNMAIRLSKDTVEVGALDQAARETLAQELFPILAEVMGGATAAEFRKNFEPQVNTVTTVQAFRTNDHKAVGYSITRRITLELSNRRIVIFRAAAAIKREFRGGGSTMMLGFRLAILWKFRHPFSEVYYFGAMLQPTSYYLMTKFAQEIWPRYNAETPPEILALIQSIADSQGLETTDPPRPYTRISPRTVIESAGERGLLAGQ